jgi:formylglycine-generating enzyme required for sulfatase activity
MKQSLILIQLVIAVSSLAAYSLVDAQTEKPLSTTLLPGQTFKECRNCPQMIVLPAGQFTMGSPADEPLRRDKWTEDCYEADRAHAPTDGSPSKEGNCANRVFRSGTFLSNPYMQRSARRGAPYPATQRGRKYLGFRVAKTLN